MKNEIEKLETWFAVRTGKDTSRASIHKKLRGLASDAFQDGQVDIDCDSMAEAKASFKQKYGFNHPTL